MIDESIKTTLNNLDNHLNFKGLLTLMEESGIDFHERKLNGPIGIATLYCIYIDWNKLSRLNIKVIFFIFLHEIGHFKRMVKVGKEHTLSMLSLEDNDVFYDHVISEEIIADRYACYVYQYLNNDNYPRYLTQELHLPSNQKLYTQRPNPIFGLIQNSEENYNKLLKTLLYER